MDELHELERWGYLFSVSAQTFGGKWRVTIAEHQEGTLSMRNWEDMRVIGEADHDPLLAIQSALIQARAKWPGTKHHD